MTGTFAKNTIATFITSIFGIILTLGISVIVTRGLGPEGKGIYALATLLTAMLVTFTNFGINSATVYYASQKRYSPKEILGNNIFIAFFLSTITILIGLIIVIFFSGILFAGVRREYLLLALSLVPVIYFSDFVSQILLGLGEVTRYNILRLAQLISVFILLSVFVLFFLLNIRAVLFIEVFSYLLSGLAIFYFVRKKTGGVEFRFNRNYFQNIFSYGIKAYLANSFWFLNQRISMFFINTFINPAGVGFYSTAFGLSERAQLLSAPISTVFFPKTASETNERKIKESAPTICRNVLFVSSIAALLLFLLSQWIITSLYSGDFLPAVSPFRVLLLGIVPLNGYAILCAEIFGRKKPLVNTYIIGAAIPFNLMLNILLIPKLGISGAALAQSIYYTIMFGITVVVYKKISHNRIADIIFIKRSDIQYYKNFLMELKNLLRLKFHNA